MPSPGGGSFGAGGHISPVSPESIMASGNIVDDGSISSAQAAADNNLGFLNQLKGSLDGTNQRILQNLMKEATEAQYAYQERMSSSAYQRAVADMKKAGLNPAVMFANGAGDAASTPSGGIAQVATENQLLSTLSSAGQLFAGLGSLLSSLLGKSVSYNYKNFLSF